MRSTNFYFLKGNLRPLLMQNSKFVNNFIVIIFMNFFFYNLSFWTPVYSHKKTLKVETCFGCSRFATKHSALET